jgi:2Fe-2S ferredoxin
MPRVTYKLADGSERAIEIAEGTSVMLGAINNNIKGIDADCGGCCSCATCHVYVDAAYLARLPPPDATEDDMLTGVAAERRPNSRLSCQIAMTAALDGLIVTLPDHQS